MRAMPPLYVLIWWCSQEQKPSVSMYVRYDDACLAYDESEAGLDVIAAARVMEVVEAGAPGRIVWSPFDISAAHRWWLEESRDDAVERDRTRAMVRREQMP